MKYFLFFLFCSIFLFSQSKMIAQDDGDNPHKPKLGVVLSGGGAKGIAHVGILKALEREGLRPDFIAGTSMGSIIGGLYAIGYTADQLDTIVRSADWDIILSNNIPLNYISYEEKEYYTRYLIELPIDKGKIKLPSGMIEGQMLSEMLTHYTWPAMKYDSFDEFPIPFRCIATNVSNGKPIVFKDGSLSDALRASMAIPTAFTPANLDTTLAVDGGVVNNFPVEELFKMGADYIIGVNVGDGFVPASELNSMAGILMQVAMIPALDRLSAQIDSCDIYIKPDLKGYSTASFGNYADILRLGYETGEKYRPEFKKLAKKWNVKPESYVSTPLQADSIEIIFISFTGNKLVSDKLIESKLGIYPGDVVSREEIEEGVRRVYGLINFSKVVYSVRHIPGFNGYKLTLQMNEKPPSSFKASVHYDNLFQAGLTANFTLRNLLGKSSRTIIAADISNNPKFRFNYLKYMGKRESYAAQFSYNYLNEEIPTYEKGQLQDVDISRENNFSLGVITTQSLKQSFYFGTAYTFFNQKKKFSEILVEGMDHFNADNFRLDFIYQANTANSRNYPTKGREISFIGEFYLNSNYHIIFNKGVDTVDFPIFGSDNSFTIPLSEADVNEFVIKPLIPDIYSLLRFNFTEFVQVRKKFQVIPAFGLGLTISADSALFFTHRIGGDQRVRFSDVRFLGLNFAEKDYANFLIGGLYLQNIILKNIYVKYGANLLLPYDFVPITNLGSFDFNKMIEDNSMIGYGIKLTYKSILGPISGGISMNSRDAYLRYYLSIGLSFNYSD